VTGILIYVLVFYAGVVAGFSLKTFLYRRGDFSGTINIFKYPDKTVFSLELEEDPDKFEARKEVVFKVNVPKEGSQENHSL
jgi:hypothetical protein